MIKKIRKKFTANSRSWIYLSLIYLFGFGLYYPAIFTFFTHDNFFHMKISRVNSIQGFLSFFNLFNAPVDWGFYRPLTTQVFYFINWKIFKTSHIWMNIMAFLFFFLVMLLVFSFVRKLINKKVALLSTLLYITSATHFTHLYFVADQELGHAIFFLSSIILFIDHLLKKSGLKLFLSWVCFIGALMSRESAIMLPYGLGIVYLWLKTVKKIKLPVKKFLLNLLPFLITLLGYLYLHTFHYGLIKGDSYIWEFTPKVFLNNLSWYGLWSLNLPQMLIDYIGPGFKINSNLFQFYPKEMLTIFSLFLVFIFLIIVAVIVGFRGMKKQVKAVILSAMWFIGLLLPVLFLPWHKFTIYLTLPLIGGVMVLSLVLGEARKVVCNKAGILIGNLFLVLLVTVYILLSTATIKLTDKTHWITSGAKTAQRVHQYFTDRYSNLENNIDVYFYDRPEDGDLPWKPSNELKVILSDNNYFSVFFEDKIQAYYVESESLITDPGAIKISARQFLGY
ncbi:MAG: hypothetical protein ABIJ43_04230 [Candidatus Beckwithbacteria bacterium]